MRMRAIVATGAVGAVLVALLAGCTPTPRAHDGPVIIPQGVAWQYATSCVEADGDVGVMAMEWSNAGADVVLESDDPAIDIPALEAQIEACLTEYRYEEHTDAYIDPYERERLYEYYSTFTVPCLANEGIEVEPMRRSTFYASGGGEPWNPYPGLNLPFERLFELYRLCPPRPASLSEADGLG
jgi:hypothetical protein